MAYMYKCFKLAFTRQNVLFADLIVLMETFYYSFLLAW